MNRMGIYNILINFKVRYSQIVIPPYKNKTKPKNNKKF